MKIISKIVNKFFNLNNPISRYLVTLKREYRVNAFEKKNYKVIEVSGGNDPLDKTYLNVDISSFPTVDVVTDLNEKLPFDDSSVDEVVSIATLEHFSIADTYRIVKEFNRVLKSGGILSIGVPSLSKIFEQYKKNGCDKLVIRYLFGAQKDKYDIHMCIVDFAKFKEILESEGFISVTEEVYDYPLHSADYMMKIVAEKK